jgi:hypothetical protein
MRCCGRSERGTGRASEDLLVGFAYGGVHYGTLKVLLLLSGSVILKPPSIPRKRREHHLRRTLEEL